MGKVESTAADIGADEAGVPAVRLDCVLFLPSWLSPPLGSPSRTSGTMSAGSNLRNSFFFSGESCSCANAPAEESKSAKTTTRTVSCVLKYVNSFHLSELQDNRSDQPDQCNQQQRDRHAVEDESEFVLESFSFLYSVRVIFTGGFRQIERRDLAIVLFGDAKRLFHFPHPEFEGGASVIRLPPRSPLSLGLRLQLQYDLVGPAAIPRDDGPGLIGFAIRPVEFEIGTQFVLKLF